MQKTITIQELIDKLMALDNKTVGVYLDHRGEYACLPITSVKVNAMGTVELGSDEE